MDIASLTPPQAVKVYLGVRDAREARKRQYEADVLPLDALLDQLGQHLQAYMNSNGLKSVPTEHGHAIQVTKTNATVSDWDAFYQFLLQTGRLDFLQKRVASTALAEYVEETTTAPPGVSFFVERQVQVRKPKS